MRTFKSNKERFDNLYRSYGFDDIKDFREQARMTIFKIIALSLEKGYPFSKYPIHISKQIKIINKYKKINVEFNCHCCKEVKHPHAMTIEHIDNNGAEHRISLYGSNVGGAGLSYVLRHGFDPKYRLVLMCANCNSSLGFYGFCPHHPEIRREMKSGRLKKSLKDNNLVDEKDENVSDCFIT